MKSGKQHINLHTPDARSAKEEASALVPDRREALKKIGSGLALGLGAGALMGRASTAEAQGITYASWIHGHTLHVQDMDKVTQLIPFGFHCEVNIRLGTANWVHLAVPTPVILDGQRLKLGTVMLNFATASVDSFVKQVDIWDGPNAVASLSRTSSVRRSPV